MCFINKFELYYNIYRNLYKIYLISTELTIEERQRSENIFLIILKPHDSKLNNVMNIIQKDYIALKRDYKLLISKKKINIYAPILAYINNIKS